MSVATLKGGSMMVLLVLVVAVVTTVVEAGTTEQQHQQQPHNLELQPEHDSTDWSPHLPTTFSSLIDHGHTLKESPISFTDEDIPLKPVKNAKKQAYIKNKSEKESSQQQHSRQKRFFLPKQKWRSVAVPVSVFNFLGFLPVRIPGLPFHYDLPSPERQPYRTRHDVPLRGKRRKGLFNKYYKF